MGPDYYVSQYRKDVPKKEGFYIFPDFYPRLAIDVGADDGSYLDKVPASKKIAIDPKPVPYIEAWASTLEYIESDVCDWMTCWVTIEHSINPEKMISDMFRVLKKGCDLHVTTPSLEYAHKHLDLNEWYRPHHNWYFTNYGLVTLFHQFHRATFTARDELWHIVATK